jgi:RNA polymerase sigma-70 factor (ECF subfamily)
VRGKEGGSGLFPGPMRYPAPVTPSPLDELVERAQAGDVRAFEALVDAQLPRIRRYARAFAAAEHDADDLAQEALVRVYRSLRSFRWQSAFSTWLFAVVRSAFLDAAKGRAGTRRALEEPLQDHHGEREGGHRPDEALDAEEDRRRVWAALREIPDEFRSAVVLFDIEGLSYDEVATIEAVAVGTVKSRLHRGRAHLRRLLGPGSDQPPEGLSDATGTNLPAASSHLRKP